MVNPRVGRSRRHNTQKDKCTIWQEDSWIHVRSPYHELFVADLKTDIPYASRKWDGAKKIWRVDPAYLDDIVDICERYFDVHVTQVEPEVVVVQGDGGGHDAYSRMLRLATPATLKKVYRLIAMDVHPDRGGSPEDMTTLNTAWDEIKKSH